MNRAGTPMNTRSIRSKIRRQRGSVNIDPLGLQPTLEWPEELPERDWSDESYRLSGDGSDGHPGLGGRKLGVTGRHPSWHAEKMTNWSVDGTNRCVRVFGVASGLRLLEIEP